MELGRIGLPDHEGRDRLAPLRIRAADNGNIVDHGVADQRLLYFGGCDVLAAGHDGVGDAALHGEGPVVFDCPAVAGVQPPVLGERLRGHHRTADQDLAVRSVCDIGTRERLAGPDL